MNFAASVSKELLNTVSRSFALCIPMLEANKVRETENMYLLSRVVDTIEDSSLDITGKKKLMMQFFRTLRDDQCVDNFVSELKKGIIDAHDMVLGVAENYRAVLDIFHSLDEEVRFVSLELLAEMSSGMVKYLEKGVESFSDMDEYCYYVAGTVGTYMNRLVALKDGVLLDQEKAVAMGRYLQKVNIIKNFRKDAEEGRRFWPSELFRESDESRMEALDAMIESARSEADDAFAYAASVPYHLAGYRQFLLLSAFMATENIKLMRKNAAIFTSAEGVKIPRNRMPLLISMSVKAASDNSLIDVYRRELEG